jgi:microcystin-dependent protein
MSDPFIGEIKMFAGNFAPRNYALCDGQLLAINQNQALFSILGTTYGGDGRTTFGLPDLQSRSPMHAGNGPGLSQRSLGAKFGLETHTLKPNQIPPLSTAPADAITNCFDGPGNTNVAAGNTWSKDAGNQSGTYNSNAANKAMQAGTVTVPSLTVNGGGQAHNITHPCLVINFIIAIQGFFPSRN